MTASHERLQFPRIVLQDMVPEVRIALEPVVKRLGYLGDAFAVHAHVPAAVGTFMEYTKAVKAPLPDALNELVALTVCRALRAEYELIQHERLALQLGFSKEWIGAAQGREDADPSLLSEVEQAVQTIALKIVATLGQDCESDIAELARRIGHSQAMAVFLQCTRFLMIAVMCRAFSLKLPVASIFE
jgi:alkylhydroperoxidase family enzyme